MRVVLMLCALGVLAGLAPSAPAPPAPKGKASAGVTVGMLRGLIGRGHFSPEASAFRDLIGRPPTAHYNTRHGYKKFYHEWKAEGIDVQFDAPGEVVNCFLYAEGHHGFGQYAGELPAKLAFGDTPAGVRKRLGEPEDVVESDQEGCTAQWNYPARGLCVTFSTPNTKDPKAKVVIVIVGATEEAK